MLWVFNTYLKTSFELVKCGHVTSLWQLKVKWKLKLFKKLNKEKGVNIFQLFLILKLFQMLGENSNRSVLSSAVVVYSVKSKQKIKQRQAFILINTAILIYA